MCSADLVLLFQSLLPDFVLLFQIFLVSIFAIAFCGFMSAWFVIRILDV